MMSLTNGSFRVWAQFFVKRSRYFTLCNITLRKLIVVFFPQCAAVLSLKASGNMNIQVKNLCCTVECDQQENTETYTCFH